MYQTNHLLLMLLFWFCCTVNAQQIHDYIAIAKIEVEEPSCEDAPVGKIVVVVETNCEGELVYIAERTSHIGQEELEVADQYTSADGVFIDCLPGCYTITVSLADHPDLSVSRSIVLSQLALSGSLTIAGTDIADKYCKKTTGSVIVRVAETAGQPEWFAMFDAVTGALVKLVTVADQGIEEDGLSCSFTGIAPGIYFFKAGNNTNSCVIQSDREKPVKFIHYLKGSATVQDVSCKGDPTGGITVRASGGVSELKYILLNEDKTVNANASGAVTGVFTSLPANNYLMVVKDAASCTDTLFNIEVREPEKVLAMLADITKPAGCESHLGTVTVSASGGWGDYMYKIDSGNYSVNPVFENLSAGIYTFFVRDKNGCELSNRVNVIYLTAPDLSKSEVRQILCYNEKGKITINAIPKNPEGSNYNKIVAYWIKGDCLEETVHTLNNIFDELNGCTYTLYAQDSYGCTGDFTVVIDEPEQIGFESIDLVHPSGNKLGSITVTVSGGWGGYTIVLTKIMNQGQQEIEQRYNQPAGVKITFSGLDAASYRIVILEDERGCKDPLAFTIRELVTATGETDLEAAKMKIFPNPSGDGRFIIEWNSSEDRMVTLELYNANGQSVYKTCTQTGTRTTIDISNQNQGTYLLYIPELGVSRKLVKQ